MTTPHKINLAVHIIAGAAGLLIGCTLLARAKGTRLHRKWGRWFAYAGLVVALSAAIGSVFFRFLPLFAVLNIAVLYELVSGWRVTYTRGDGPVAFHALWTVTGVAATVLLVPVLMAKPEAAPPVIAYSTLGALAILLVHDTVRWAFPRRWHQVVWQYEHVSKIVAALFGMLSAFVGNVVRFGQSWSQALPWALGVW